MSQQEIDRKEAGVDDDPNLLSPPIVVEPLYQCATAVVVLGAVTGAKIEVEVNGAAVGSAVVHTVLPYGITIVVPKLVANDKVRARQQTATAKQLLQLISDFDAQRRMDLQNIQRGLGQYQTLTNAEIASQRDNLIRVNELIRANSKQER